MSVTVVLEGGRFDGQELWLDEWRPRVHIMTMFEWPTDYCVYIATDRKLRGLEIFTLEREAA